ncbi:hypothetical protein SAMN06295967_107128 [Belliella buryatensis]|uniref:Uncharacterized protein n=1 Tax=Belliella buryatensis TaxID=1500549 RepID=A0A239DLN5_9BACT|nr:hypothetical protein [Belliella buryatensis]SNS33347.1 hypothetical protein SAMN06295967_107128 [Belliella buryatensis]
MKTTAIILSFFFIIGLANAQSEKKVETKPTKTELPEKAEKGSEISEMATTIEGGKEKGLSISSAARRSTLMRERATKGAENAETGRERAEMGATNSEKGKEISNQARAGQMRPDKPVNGARPNITVPQARPNLPIVRPGKPEKPSGRPATPPGRPGGVPGGI